MGSSQLVEACEGQIFRLLDPSTWRRLPGNEGVVLWSFSYLIAASPTDWTGEALFAAFLHAKGLRHLLFLLYRAGSVDFFLGKSGCYLTELNW